MTAVPLTLLAQGEPLGGLICGGIPAVGMVLLLGLLLTGGNHQPAAVITTLLGVVAAGVLLLAERPLAAIGAAIIMVMVLGLTLIDWRLANLVGSPRSAGPASKRPTAAAPIYCPKCETANAALAVRCDKCGHPLAR